MGERHLRLWDWFESLTKGDKPDPRVEGWPRGGAKSSTAELAVAYVGQKGSRKYCLYVSETQDQADKHVASIATALERAGVDRSLNKYGHSKGWRRNQLRAANGFNVEALGLDTAARGIKLDEFRPDMIIFDDIDNQKDSPKITTKKELMIKSSIIPAGSSDCAVLFIQNVIMEDGIFAKLVDGRADFLLKRDVPPVEKAVNDLEVKQIEDPKRPGRMIYEIIGGEATWEGQNLVICEGQINEWGLGAFLRESQHEVAGADGIYFDVTKIRFIENEADLPPMVALCRAWDLAATEGGGDYTVGVLMGRDASGVYYILDIIRGQWGSDKVRKVVADTAIEDNKKWGVVMVRVPQDPGQAGKAQGNDFTNDLAEKGISCVALPVQGRKGLRARDLQEDSNSSNVLLLRAPWNKEYTEEARKFREDEQHDYDDQIDAAVDAHNEIQVFRFEVFT